MYHEKYRSDKFPADSPIDPRRKADHVFNIRAEPICSVDPANSDRLCQNCEQHRVPGCVAVQQVEKVKPTLCTRIKHI